MTDGDLGPGSSDIDQVDTDSYSSVTPDGKSKYFAKDYQSPPKLYGWHIRNGALSKELDSNPTSPSQRGGTTSPSTARRKKRQPTPKPANAATEDEDDVTFAEETFFSTHSKVTEKQHWADQGEQRDGLAKSLEENLAELEAVLSTDGLGSLADYDGLPTLPNFQKLELSKSTKFKESLRAGRFCLSSDTSFVDTSPYFAPSPLKASSSRRLQTATSESTPKPPLPLPKTPRREVLDHVAIPVLSARKEPRASRTVKIEYQEAQELTASGHSHTDIVLKREPSEESMPLYEPPPQVSSKRKASGNKDIGTPKSVRSTKAHRSSSQKRHQNSKSSDADALDSGLNALSDSDEDKRNHTAKYGESFDFNEYARYLSRKKTPQNDIPLDKVIENIRVYGTWNPPLETSSDGMRSHNNDAPEAVASSQSGTGSADVTEKDPSKRKKRSRRRKDKEAGERSDVDSKSQTKVTIVEEPEKKKDGRQEVSKKESKEERRRRRKERKRKKRRENETKGDKVALPEGQVSPPLADDPVDSSIPAIIVPKIKHLDKKLKANKKKEIAEKPPTEKLQAPERDPAERVLVEDLSNKKKRKRSGTESRSQKRVRKSESASVIPNDCATIGDDKGDQLPDERDIENRNPASSTVEKKKNRKPARAKNDPEKQSVMECVTESALNTNSVSPSKRVPAGTSIIVPPPLDAENFGLIQEEVGHNPYHLLIAVVFLQKTKGSTAIPVFREFIERWPTPEDLLNRGTQKDVEDMFQPLGLQATRSKTVWMMAHHFHSLDPYKMPLGPASWKVRNDYRPKDPTGMDRKWGCIIGGVYGCGKYAIDSWRIFSMKPGEGGFLDGTTLGERSKPKKDTEVDPSLPQTVYPNQFAPGDEEWRRIPDDDPVLDKELKAYVKWMKAKDEAGFGTSAPNT